MGSSPRPTHEHAPRTRLRLLYARRVSLLSFLLALPGLVVTVLLLWSRPWGFPIKAAILFMEVGGWWLGALVLQEHATRPLQTLANVVAALRQEDYSFRARNAVPDDALGELSLEVNALADMLADQRIRAIEATALLRRVVEEIESPLFVFDSNDALRLVNSAGERLLQLSAARVVGSTAQEIGAGLFLSAPNDSLIVFPPDNSQARWLVRRSSIRQNGVPHTLVVLSDVAKALREEERSAWQRLLRVLGHELNNSLAPIKSIAGSLSMRLRALSLSPEEKEDFVRGLEIIEGRAASLHRFLQGYRRLTQIPKPNLQPTVLSSLLNRVAGLENRVAVRVVPGPDVDVMADADQVEQMLINLVRNATEAVLEMAAGDDSRGAEVTLSWRVARNSVAVTVEDSGPGLLNSANLFTPFYTTKPSGSGVGLVLCRQIAEAHGGSIELANRSDGHGCRATVTLPRNPVSAI